MKAAANKVKQREQTQCHPQTGILSMKKLDLVERLMRSKGDNYESHLIELYYIHYKSKHMSEKEFRDAIAIR